jgi:hypothetical protein
MSGSELRWQPDRVLELLPMVTLLLNNKVPGGRLRCRLTLNGRALTADKHPDRLLNGLALTRPRPDGTTEVILPTVNDVRGADFTFWFWINLPSLDGAFDVSRFDKNVFS